MDPTEEQTYRKAIDEKLELILAQTTKTNGSVLALRSDVDAIKLWKARAEGFTGAINIGWTAFVAILGAVISGAFIYFKH